MHSKISSRYKLWHPRLGFHPLLHLGRGRLRGGGYPPISRNQLTPASGPNIEESKQIYEIQWAVIPEERMPCSLTAFGELPVSIIQTNSSYFSKQQIHEERPWVLLRVPSSFHSIPSTPSLSADIFGGWNKRILIMYSINCIIFFVLMFYVNSLSHAIVCEHWNKSYHLGKRLVQVFFAEPQLSVPPDVLRCKSSLESFIRVTLDSLLCNPPIKLPFVLQILRLIEWPLRPAPPASRWFWNAVECYVNL